MTIFGRELAYFRGYIRAVTGCGNYSKFVFVGNKGWNGRIAGYATVSATRLSIKISR